MQSGGQTTLADFDIDDYLLFDSTDAAAIPETAEAIAGYVDGRWPTYAAMRTRFPHAYAVAITVTGDTAADVIDCERGDATPQQAVQWVREMRRLGHWAPGIYASVSAWPELLRLLSLGGVERDHFRCWTAHWTGRPHRCDESCQRGFLTRAGATQWTSQWRGLNVDASMAWRPFFVRPRSLKI